MLNFVLGCIAGVIIANIAFFIVLAFCRVAAEADPESEYYEKVG